jgi:hypothetical protein
MSLDSAITLPRSHGGSRALWLLTLNIIKIICGEQSASCPHLLH